MLRKYKMRLVLAYLSTVAASVLVACGGGGAQEEATDPVAEVERQRAQGIFDKLPVSWAPSSLVFNLYPGARQDVSITLTTTKALTNARIVFVPDLRNAVTVAPDVIRSLAAGQSATVTLTFAPAATDRRKQIAGVVLLFDKNATVSRPLPVKVSLVAPDVINGISVPPEPPLELNNTTLAGFDVNGNGVRDDVERLIAARFGSDPTKRAFATSVAKSMQAMFLAPSPATLHGYVEIGRCVLDDAVLADGIVIEKAMLSSTQRRRLYGTLTAGTVIDMEGC